VILPGSKYCTMCVIFTYSIRLWVPILAWWFPKVGLCPMNLALYPTNRAD
jgi:hypothetical protein